MNSTEASSSLKCSISSQKSQLARIEVFVFLTFLLSFVLFPLGIVRRRYNSSALKVIALGANATIILLVPYIFGMMRTLVLKHELVSVWAVFLFYVYYNVPTILNFSDSLTVVVTCVKLILYVYYVSAVYSRITGRSYSLLLILLAVSVWKAGEALFMRAAITADKVSMGFKIRMPNIDGGDVDAVADLSRPVGSNDPLLTCRYVVFSVDRVFTIQEIWGCEEAGHVLSSSEDLKNDCLSLALFWFLRSKFAGSISTLSSEQEDDWNLVRNGLLLSSSGCPFRVIEVELAFFYDYLYNTSCFLLYVSGLPCFMIRHLLCLVGISSAVVLTLEKYHPKEETARIQYHKHDVDVLLTLIVIIASILLELVQIVMYLCSKWSKMLLLRTYLAHESWKDQTLGNWCIRKAAEIILCPARGGGGELFKPWQRQLGQYSILDSYSYMHHPLIKIIIFVLNALTGNRFVRPGRKQSKSAPLTNEIKKVVIRALLDRGRQLTNGITTLQASDQLPPETKRKLAWACTQLGTDAQVVLIWHIATSLCEISLNQLPSGTHDDYCIDDVHVATSLSNYSAYLVAFAPDMLPGNVACTTNNCSVVIENAYHYLRSCTEESHIYDAFMNIAVKDGVDIDYDDPNRQRDAASLLQRSGVLGKLLVTEIVDPRKRWKFLAGFWAELLLYLAPNAHNEWAHVERLADGGEFITHLWVLLFHAGIVDRDSFSNKAKDAEADSQELHQVG